MFSCSAWRSCKGALLTALSHPSSIQTPRPARQIPAISCPFLVGTFGVGGDFPSAGGTVAVQMGATTLLVSGQYLPSGVTPVLRSCCFQPRRGAGHPFCHPGQHLWARILSLFSAPHPAPATAIFFPLLPSFLLLLSSPFACPHPPSPEPPACAGAACPAKGQALFSLYPSKSLIPAPLTFTRL